MDKMTRKKLVALAKQRGFVRYSRLNNEELKSLLERGYHKFPQTHYLWVYSSKGITPADFVLPSKTNKYMKYTIETKMYRGTSSRIIRGIDLTGLFNARFIPDSYEFSDDDYVFVKGGWVVSDTEYSNFCTFYDSLLASINHPKSLLEIAAWAVNSRKRDHYIPTQLKIEINHVVSQYFDI